MSTVDGDTYRISRIELCESWCTSELIVLVRVLITGEACDNAEAVTLSRTVGVRVLFGAG